MPKGPKVTDEEIQYILKYYRSTDTKEMAEKLSRAQGSIRALYSRESRKVEDDLYTDEDY